MTVHHAQGSYPIHFQPAHLSLKMVDVQSPVITDANVHTAYSELLKGRNNVLVLPAGESTKSMDMFVQAQKWLANIGATRKTELVVLGGGVVGDLGGFVAATYMRGIPFIQIPTSLLAQVDSSVGGKVGVDLEEGKNLVGAFYPSKSVTIDEAFLSTLPQAEFINGMAEVWKYGFIMDRNLVETLERSTLNAHSPHLTQVIHRCITLKAQVVQEDEFETLGRRAILNFGHTIGHALEQITGYSELRHGEAIAVGMVAEAHLGEILGLTPKGTTQRIRAAMSIQGLPTHHAATTDWDRMQWAMRRDKKVEGGHLAFSLLSEIGACTLIKDVEEGAVKEALAFIG